MRKNGFFLNTIIAFTIITAASVQAQTLYQVDVLVFSNNNPAAETEESWPQQPILDYPNNLNVLVPDVDTSTDTSTVTSSNTTIYKRLPANKKILNEWRDRLRGSGKYRILAHTSWLQPAIGLDAGNPVLITGGNQYNNHFELEGSIQISGNSPMKLKSNLWLTTFSMNGNDNKITLPGLPAVSLYTETGASQKIENTSLIYYPQRVITQKAEENLLLNKAVYIDHPMMGVIVKVTEFKPETASVSADTSTAIAPL